MVTFVRYLQHTQGIHTRSIMLTQVIHIHIRIVRAYLSNFVTFLSVRQVAIQPKRHILQKQHVHVDWKKKIENKKKIPVSPWM